MIVSYASSNIHDLQQELIMSAISLVKPTPSYSLYPEEELKGSEDSPAVLCGHPTISTAVAY
jgi:hypothetical protein